jgi:hypothetical protein
MPSFPSTRWRGSHRFWTPTLRLKFRGLSGVYPIWVSITKSGSAANLARGATWLPLEETCLAGSSACQSARDAPWKRHYDNRGCSPDYQAVVRQPRHPKPRVFLGGSSLRLSSISKCVTVAYNTCAVTRSNKQQLTTFLHSHREGGAERVTEEDRPFYRGSSADLPCLPPWLDSSLDHNNDLDVHGISKCGS